MKGIGYIFAIAFGYVLGTLWAPRKGEHLRAELVDHFIGLKEQGTELARDTMERSKEITEIAKDSLGKAGNSLSQAKDVATETVTNLNKNLHQIVDDGKNVLIGDKQ